jgi:hypothetical protein
MSVLRSNGLPSTRPADYLLGISKGFGPHSREQWLALTRPMLKPSGNGFKPHYDPAIAVPFKAVTPEQAAAGQAMLWRSYDAIRCPTLLLRGAESDLLTRETAQAMGQRGPKAKAARVHRHRPRPDARRCGAGRRGAGVPALAMKTPARSEVASLLRPLFSCWTKTQRRRRRASRSINRRGRARFAEPLIGESLLDTGENVLAHADAVADILSSIGAAPSLRAAAYLVYAADHLGKPDE